MNVNLTPLGWLKIAATGVFLAFGLYVFTVLAFLLDGTP